MTETTAYKIMTEAAWAAMRRDGSFAGSADDLADGYVHLSTASQLPGTLDRHFPDRTGLVVLAIDLAQLGAALRWEPSRGGQAFPHLYGPLPLSAVRGTAPP